MSQFRCAEDSCLLREMSLLFQVFICFSLSRWQDYVDVQSPQNLLKDEAEYPEAKRLRAASVALGKT